MDYVFIGLFWWIVQAFVISSLRKTCGFFQRINDANWQALIVVDIVVAYFIFWPLYLVYILPSRPLPWATISATCGYYAREGKRWSIASAKIIDFIFLKVTGEKDHCDKSYINWSAPVIKS